MHRRSNALARAFARLGVSEGDGVAVMCRNHRGFVDASIATAKLGADLLYLNTAFAGPQLVDVLERERPVLVVHDEEFTGLLEKADVGTSVLGVDRLGRPRPVPRWKALIGSEADPDLDPGRPARPDRDPDLRHHRVARRVRRAARPGSTPPSRCCRGCR